MFSFRLKIKLAFLPWTRKLQWRCARYFLVTVLLEKMLQQWQEKDVLVQERVMAMLLVEGTAKSAALAAQVTQ